MGLNRRPRPGEIYKQDNDRMFQIITIAFNTEAKEEMVVYQALYGDFKTYASPLTMFFNELDDDRYPKVLQEGRFELNRTPELEQPFEQKTAPEPEGTISALLIEFLEANSYQEKLELLTSNRKHIDHRLITDMAVALDVVLDEGPLEEQIQGIINCLQAMSRFENRRLR